MAKPPSRFFTWFDGITAEAAATPAGQMMAAAGFAVTHTGGGCLAWEKEALGYEWAIMITDDDAGLGLDRGATFETAPEFMVMLSDNETGDFVNGPGSMTVADCIAWGVAALAKKLSEIDAAKPACPHRNDGRGRCIDCGGFI